MAVTIEKRDFPKIKLTKDGKVLYNGIDLSGHCSGISADTGNRTAYIIKRNKRQT